MIFEVNSTLLPMISLKSKHWIPFYSIMYEFSKKVEANPNLIMRKISTLDSIKHMLAWLSFAFNYRYIGKFKGSLKTSDKSDARIVPWKKLTSKSTLECFWILSCKFPCKFLIKTVNKKLLYYANCRTLALSAIHEWLAKTHLDYGNKIYDQAFNNSFHQKFESLQ